MSKLKSYKSLVKRFRVTKKGKVMKRKAGQDHFNAPESSRITRMKRREKELQKSQAKTVKKLI